MIRGPKRNFGEMKDLTVAAVAMRSGFGRIESNLDKMENFVRMAARQGAEVVCFPEMNISGYALREDIRKFAEPVPGPAASRVQRMADEHDIIIVAGLAERTEDERIAITQIVASPGGGLGAYRKLHLSEGEQNLFRAGSEIPVFNAGETAFGVQLCYDAHFPELSAMLALEGAEVLFVPHASPARESAGEKRDRWLRYLAARAYDNSVFLVACNQVGDGDAGIRFPGVILIFDPRGQVIAETSGPEENMLVAELKADLLEKTRDTRMGFFLAYRRPELYGVLTAPMADTAIGRPNRGAGSCVARGPKDAERVRAASNT